MRGWLAISVLLIVGRVVGRVAFTSCVCVVVACWWLGSAVAAADPFFGRGMWIWYVSRSAGGNVAAIAAQARLNGIRTLFVKSGDGVGYWSQFSGSLVRGLHAAGLNVCAWQYVYGTNPDAEAAVGARAVRTGADCLVIDAEGEYQGRYASAQTYIDSLRAAVGDRYPVGLASFPYVDYHPGFPYSVFLGHGGAQFNLPQMYWRDIGSSVQTVYQHAYTDNRIYRRPIRPIGQTSSGASWGEIALFRGLSVGYHARGLSWWDFAWASATGLWPAVSGLYTSPSRIPPLGFPPLGLGAKGDMVLWLQELLASQIPAEQADGIFGPKTLASLRLFQVRHRIPPTGQAGPLTWQALLHLPVVSVRWASADVHSPRRTRGTAASIGSRTAPAPGSAALPAVAYEIHPPTGNDGSGY